MLEGKKSVCRDSDPHKSRGKNIERGAGTFPKFVEKNVAFKETKVGAGNLFPNLAEHLQAFNLSGFTFKAGLTKDGSNVASSSRTQINNGPKLGQIFGTNSAQSPIPIVIDMRGKEETYVSKGKGVAQFVEIVGERSMVWKDCMTSIWKVPWLSQGN